MEGRRQREDSLIDLASRRRGRLLLFGLLYVSEGAPIGFLWWALPTELRHGGLAVERITALTAAITLPWALKFVWAPLVDVLRGPRFGLRHWILASQAFMGLSLLPLARLDDFAASYGLVLTLLIVHAVAAATQDVAIDAWAIGVTPSSERGALSASMQVGKFAGRWLFGAGLLLVGGALHDPAAIYALIGFIWSSGALVLMSRESESTAPAAVLWARLQAFADSLLSTFGRQRGLLGLGIALISGAGFEAMGAVSGPLLVDRGLTPDQVGRFYTLSVAAMIAGGLAGGALVDRIGKRGTVAGLLALIACQVWAVAAVDAAGAGRSLLTIAMVVAYVGYGMFIAASYALFMDLTDREARATQFSAYMGATNACETWSTWAVGALAARSGYPSALGTMAAASLIALPLLARLRTNLAPRS